MLKQILLKVLGDAVTLEIEDLLMKYREKYGDDKANALLENLSTSLQGLAGIAAETKTSWDDSVIAILTNALPK